MGTRSEAETFTVTLTDAVNATIDDASATGTITDDDVPSVEVSFEQGSYSVDEGDTVDVTVTLSEDPERTVTIPMTTTDQDGASSADYSGVPASVTFNADDTEVDITFTATQDQDNDDGESVKLSFGNTLPTGVSAGTTDEAVVTITDDDVPSVEVSFEQSSYSVDEGDTVDVTVTLSEDPERTVTIPMTTTDQDGASSADYSGVPASVTFAPDDTEQTFTFTADEDTIERRRGEREAELREHPADRGECWDHRRGGGHDHGRRRASGACELRAVLLSRGRGELGHGQGHAERRS